MEEKKGAIHWSPIIEKLNKKDRFVYLDQILSRFKKDKFKTLIDLDERARKAIVSSICHLRNELAPLPRGNHAFFKILEAANYLGISQQTMRNWHHNCKLVPDLISKGGYRHYSLRQLNLFKRSRKKYRDKAMIKKSLNKSLKVKMIMLRRK